MAKGKDIRPSAYEAAQRLLIFRFQIAHAISNPPPLFLAEQLEAMPDAERKKTIQGYTEKVTLVCASLRIMRLWDAMTEDEQKFVSTPPHKQDYGSFYEAECKIEAAACLMWALKMIDELPAWDAEADAKLLSKIPPQQDAALHLINHATLRKENIIDEARDTAELWHWRSHMRELEEDGATPPKKSKFATIDEVVRYCTGEYYKSGKIPEPIDGDFPAFGKAYRATTNNEWMRLRTLSIERHRAFNWLCGFAPKNRWDKTPTEV